MAIATSIKLITAATSNAVTTAEANYWPKVDVSDATDNAFMDTLVVSAQRQVEAYTNRVLNDTVYEFNLSAFPAGGIVLPFSKLKVLTSIKYYDTSNNIQTWADTNYFYDLNETPPVVRYVDSSPDTYNYRVDAVTVKFTVGFTSPEVIPEGLKVAIKYLMTDIYENRVDMPREKFTAWKSIAYPFRIWHSTSDNK